MTVRLASGRLLATTPIAAVAWAVLILGVVVARGQVPDTTDPDGDGYANAADNCDSHPNADQQDGDGDRVGDACDECRGTELGKIGPDGLPATLVDQFGCTLSEECDCDKPRRKGGRTWRSRAEYLRCVRTMSRSFERRDLMDAAALDAARVAARTNGCGYVRSLPGDTDGDGVPDDGDGDGALTTPCTTNATKACDDNCRFVRNPKQRNSGGTPRGDACSVDADGDSVLDRFDNCIRVANPDQNDGDDDEVGDACDVCPGTDEHTDVDEQGCDD